MCGVHACVRVCSGLHELPPFLVLQNADEFFKDEIDLFHENKQQVCLCVCSPISSMSCDVHALCGVCCAVTVRRVLHVCRCRETGLV